MIPVLAAIEEGAWIRISYNTHAGEFSCQTRLISFEEVALASIDRIGESELNEINQGKLFLLALEVVLTSKAPMTSWFVRDRFILVDQEGYTFNAVTDDHLVEDSQFAMGNRLNRFMEGRRSTLNPKMKAAGALLFHLPEEVDARYCLSVEDGSLEAI